MKILLFLIFVSSNLYAYSADNSIAVDRLHNYTKNFINKTKPISFVKLEEKISFNFKKGQCIKYRKNKEDFWSDKETLVLYIRDIGKKHYKVQQISFTKLNKWFFDKANFALVVDKQKDFVVTDCPLNEYKASKEEIEQILKSRTQ